MEELLTAYELGKRLRIPADWLRKEAKAGRIPCLKAGRRLIFNAEAVSSVLSRRAAQEPTEQVAVVG